MIKTYLVAALAAVSLLLLGAVASEADDELTAARKSEQRDLVISMMKKFVRSLPNFSTNTYVLISIILNKQTL